MKPFLCIAMILLLTFCAKAQSDTAKTMVNEPQKAPMELQKLLEDITTEETKKVSRDADIEVDGLLFDETRTKNGRDFYDYFYRDWQAPANAKNYSIYLSEKPYRLTTTMIEIRINETLVFQAFLQPRSDYLEMLAEQAVAQTKIYLENYEALLKQLEGADQSGTGIF